MRGSSFLVRMAAIQLSFAENTFITDFPRPSIHVQLKIYLIKILMPHHYRQKWRFQSFLKGFELDLCGLWWP